MPSESDTILKGATIVTNVLIPITVKGRNGKWTTKGVLGEFATDFLAVHPRLGNKRMWTVTHVPTGACIIHCQNKRQAIAVAQAIEPLIDWQFTRPNLPLAASAEILKTAKALGGTRF